MNAEMCKALTAYFLFLQSLGVFPVIVAQQGFRNYEDFKWYSIVGPATFLLEICLRLRENGFMNEEIRKV